MLLLPACSGRSGVEVVAGPDASTSDAGALEAGDTGAPDAEAEAGPEVGCVDACNAAKSAGCPNDDLSDCVLACEDLAGAYPACLAEIAAYNACMTAAPPAAWSCDSDGFAKLSACTPELGARESCRAADQ